MQKNSRSLHYAETDETLATDRLVELARRLELEPDDNSGEFLIDARLLKKESDCVTPAILKAAQDFML